jgi:hypothetical protein
MAVAAVVVVAVFLAVVEAVQVVSKVMTIIEEAAADIAASADLPDRELLLQEQHRVTIREQRDSLVILDMQCYCLNHWVWVR